MTDPNPNLAAGPTSTQPGTPAPEPARTEPVPVAPPVVASATPSGVPYVAPPVPAAPAVAAPAPRRRGMIDGILVVAAVVAIGGIGFAAGRLTAPASTPTRVTAGFPNGGFGNGTFGNNGNGQGNGGQAGNGGFIGRGFGGGLAIQGEITEIAADHLTLKLASGQTVQIPLDASTQYHQQTGASSGDVKTGSQVLVQLSTGAAAAPGASGAPNAGGGRTLPAAANVTIVGQ